MSEDKVRRKDWCWSVRAVYVLEKLSNVSGPGLEEAGRYRLRLTRPEAMGSVLPDLEATGSISPNPLGAGSISPNPKDVVSVLPKATCSVLPDALGMGSVMPDPKDMISVSSDGDPYRLQPLQVQAYGPRSKL